MFVKEYIIHKYKKMEKYPTYTQSELNQWQSEGGPGSKRRVLLNAETVNSTWKNRYEEFQSTPAEDYNVLPQEERSVAEAVNDIFDETDRAPAHEVNTTEATHEIATDNEVAIADAAVELAAEAAGKLGVTMEEPHDGVQVGTSEFPSGIILEHFVSQTESATRLELPALDEESTEHSVVIVSTHSEVGPEVTMLVDGEDVGTEGVEQVSDVIALAKAELNNDTSSVIEAEDMNKVESEQITEEKTAGEQSTPVENEKKRVVIQALMPYLRGNKAALEVMQQAGIDPKLLQERLKTGDIVIDEDSTRAMINLTRNISPESSIWREDPRNPSQIGAASKEARDTLSTVLRSIYK